MAKVKKKHLKMKLEKEIRRRAKDFEVYQRKPWTCVTFTVDICGKVRNGMGFSKVCFPDEWDTQYGIKIAYGRAIAYLIKDLIKEKREDG